MSGTTLQRTLVELNATLSAHTDVELLGLTPHLSARDSFVARVHIRDDAGDIRLRSLSEDIYRTTGALVIFRSDATLPGC